MEHLELVLFGILIAVAALTFLARALGIPYPIPLVVGGSLLGFIPGVPNVQLDPDIVLLLFLPPLLFNAAYFTSLRDLRQNTRPIVLTSIGLVLVTMGAVAVVAHELIDGMPWAVAFALGAIVAPTDPLAASSILGRLGVPRRLLAVIEGESLVNDGSALVAYRTAVAVAVGGSFDALDAGLDFVVSVVGGIAVGMVAGWILIRVFRRIVDDATLGVTISLACGYAAYLPAEELGVSGVLAAVTVGLVVGRRSPEISSAQGRLQAYAFWEVLVFILNAVLFVLVGLQLPGILDDQSRSTGELIGLGLLVSGVVIGCRLLWTGTVPYLVRMLDRRPSQLARRVGWQQRLVASWCGMRGVVSLAAALALPLQTDAGTPLPERDLVIFLAFSVIFVTLVFQGLTLPVIIRWTGVEDDGSTAYEELIARKTAARAAIDRIEVLMAEEWTRDDTLERMTGLYEFRYRRLSQRAATFKGRELDDGDEDLEERSFTYQRTVHDVIAAQRTAIVGLRDEGQISDNVMHLLERELDLEEERLEI